jgi:hypothetical protein
LDSCGAHPQASGVYHNHLFPSCLYSSSNTGKHSQLLGYAFDGYPGILNFFNDNISKKNLIFLYLVYGPW